jgi:hypothetical protein
MDLLRRAGAGELSGLLGAGVLASINTSTPRRMTVSTKLKSDGHGGETVSLCQHAGGCLLVVTVVSAVNRLTAAAPLNPSRSPTWRTA